MDLNYSISSLQFSLEVMCNVKIVEHVLTACGRRPDNARPKAYVITQAAGRIDNWKIPTILRTSLKRLLAPIDEELENWYRHVGCCSTLTWTPQGSVDTVRSTKVLLESELMDDRKLFKIACQFGHVSHIYAIGKRLSNHIMDNDEIPPFLRPSMLEAFWYGAVQRSAVAWVTDSDVPQQEYNNGLLSALTYCEEAGRRFFIGKATASAIEYMATNKPHMVICLELANYSASTVSLLYSKLDSSWQSHCLSNFSYALLRSLVDWPYQQIFLKAAERLVDNLTPNLFAFVLKAIDQKASRGFIDWDYIALLNQFYEMGSGHLHRAFHNDRWYASAAFEIVRMGNRHLTERLLNDLSVDQRQEVLFAYNYRVCHGLLQSCALGALEQFIRGCTVNRPDMLVRFREAFVRLYRDDAERSGNRNSEDRLQRFVDIVDRVVADNLQNS